MSMLALATSVEAGVGLTNVEGPEVLQNRYRFAGQRKAVETQVLAQLRFPPSCTAVAQISQELLDLFWKVVASLLAQSAALRLETARTSEEEILRNRQLGSGRGPQTPNLEVLNQGCPFRGLSNKSRRQTGLGPFLLGSMEIRLRPFPFNQVLKLHGCPRPRHFSALSAAL